MFPGAFDALGAVQKRFRKALRRIKSGLPIPNRAANFESGGHARHTPIRESDPQDTAGVPLSAGRDLQGKRQYERRSKFQVRQTDLEVVGKEESEVGTQKSSIPQMRSQCCTNFMAAKPQECCSLQPP